MKLPSITFYYKKPAYTQPDDWSWRDEFTPDAKFSFEIDWYTSEDYFWQTFPWWEPNAPTYIARNKKRYKNFTLAFQLCGLNLQIKIPYKHVGQYRYGEDCSEKARAPRREEWKQTMAKLKANAPKKSN